MEVSRVDWTISMRLAAVFDVLEKCYIPFQLSVPTHG